jgi:hypothetical protein
MTIMLNWTTTVTPNTRIHSISELGIEESTLRKTIEACTDKSIDLLKTNIQDDSLYLLFEWNEESTTLNIAVTDATKQNDAPALVSCTFPHLALALVNEEQKAANTESIKFWLHDYLTTCAAFFSYSLVAIFHSSTRNNTELL